jgi:hypothetical protein
MSQDDVAPETLETWIGDYVDSNRRMQRLVEMSLNTLAEQDRRLYNLIHRYSRSDTAENTRETRQMRQTRQTRQTRETRQSNLDNYLRPTSDLFAGARVVGQSPRVWRAPPTNLNFINPFPTSLPTNPLFAPNDFLSPVLVRPTETQIAAATRRVRYSSVANPLNTACPITQTEFLSTDNVVEILHCHHVFSESAFDQWFQQNVQCPLCRYDIRNHPIITSGATHATSTTSVADVTPPIQSAPSPAIFNQITRLLQAGLVNSGPYMPTDSSGNITVSYNVDIQGPD